MQDAQLISQAGQVESLASDGLVSVSTGAGQPQKNMELAKFADSLGSSVPLQQTSEQVSITGLYARTSDGKMVELTKESVASVMAGLVVSFPKYGAIDDANLDDIKTVGTYTVGDGCTNKPANETWNHSMLQVVVGRNDWVTQIYYSGAYGKIYIRHFKYNATSTGEWSSWSTINFGYNTLEELSSGVAEQMGYIGKKSYTLESGQEIGTGLTGAGAYIIFNASAGRSSLVVAGAIVLGDSAIVYNDADISQSLSTSGKVCFNRKAVNGEFFLKNNHTTSLNITIVTL